MDVGFEPGRVHQLTRRTLEAIDTLDALASPDPAAAEALRTIRLTRRNLEDHWMPALQAIARSDTMARWRASNLTTVAWRSRRRFDESLPDHLAPAATGNHPTATIPPERRSELLGRLDRFERRAMNAHAERTSGVDPVGAPTPDELGALGRQLAWWSARDDAFAAELVELSVSNLLIGRLLGEASFPTNVAAAVVRHMAVANGPDTNVDHDRYARALDAALAALTDDPDTCLDLLLDRPTTYALASWTELHTSTVSEFVASGLYDAVDADPERLSDGYRVLAFLTRASNGPLDDGMSAGMALGLAASLPGYIDTLAPAIEQEGPTPVVIRSANPPVELGTYDDLVDLFGAVIRQPDAQPAIGAALAGYTYETFERVGGQAATRPDVTHLADFADLIGDASRSEQAELVVAAAVQEARRRRLSGLIGFGSNAALLAGGVGSVARSLVGQAVKAATTWRTDGAPRRLADGHLPALTYDLITVAAVSVAANDPSTRHGSGLLDVTAAQWARARRHVDAIEQLDEPHARMLAVGDLDHWITTSVPALAAHLLELRTMPGMNELKERRNAVGPD